MPQIIVNGLLVSEQIMEIADKLKKIFDQAKKDQRGKLFISFAAIATHLVCPEKSLMATLKAVHLDNPSPELAQFFNEDGLLNNAKTALEFLAEIDNQEPDSWGSFVEFIKEDNF